jgi:hypothetical protein
MWHSHCSFGVGGTTIRYPISDNRGGIAYIWNSLLVAIP